MELQIKRIQQERGITNLQLAAKLGVSAQYAGALANGRVGASLDKYEAIAEALNVKLWQLFADPSEYVLPSQIPATPIINQEQTTTTIQQQEEVKPDLIMVDRETGETRRYQELL